MATKNDGTVKRITRKRQAAPRTARKPRLAETASAEIAQERWEGPALELAPEPQPEPAPAVVPAPAPAPSMPAPVVELAPPPVRRSRRAMFVRAMLRRIRREAERRAAPIARRVGRRFPRLVAIGQMLRFWF